MRPTPSHGRATAVAGSLLLALGSTAASCTGPDAAAPSSGATWQALEPAPVSGGPRFAHAAVWTGQEVVVWGGTRRIQPCHETGDGGGAALDPGTGAWRRLPEGPLSPRASPRAHWTGTEVLVVGGVFHGYPCTRAPLADAAAYRPDPAGGAGSWRPLPPWPLPAGAWLEATAWTGTQLLVWAGLDGGAAYDPARNTWRTLPTPPPPATPLPPRVELPPGNTGQVSADSTWTGEDWLVWSTVTTGDGSGGVRWSLAYRPEDDTWRPVADGPWDAVGAEHVWTGSEVLAPSLPPGTGQPSAIARYDPVDDAWSRSAPSPEPMQRAGVPGATAWVGDRLVTWAGAVPPAAECPEGPGDGCGADPVPVTYAYDPARDTWQRLEPGPWEQHTGVPAVWTGEELVVTGGRSDWPAGELPVGPALPAGSLTLAPAS